MGNISDYYEPTDTGYLHPEQFFDALRLGKLGPERLTSNDHLTYLSCASNPVDNQEPNQKPLNSHLSDFIASHHTILTPFSQTLQDIPYSPNKGFGEKAIKKITRTENILTKIRGYSLDIQLLENIYAHASKNNPRLNIIHTGSNIGVSRIDSENGLKEHNKRYAENLEQTLSTLPTDELALVLVNGNASNIAKPLEQYLWVA